MKQSKRWSVLALATFVIAAGGCEDRLDTPTAPEVKPSFQRGAAGDTLDTRDDPGRPSEWESTRLARQIPGFGGFAFDSVGNIEVYLSHPSNAAAANAARAALQPMFARWNPGSARRAARPEVIIRQGEHTFLQLRQWRDRTSVPVLHVDGVAFVDLDESVNRIVVGIDRDRPAAVRGAVRSTLATWGVPDESVEYEEVELSDGGCLDCEPWQPPPGYEIGPGTLSDRLRPVRGGYRIVYEGPAGTNDGKACTLGFNAKLSDGTPVFVTASHCTKQRAHLDNDRFYQNTLYDSNDYIGREGNDPPWSANWYASVNIDGTVYPCNDDNAGTTTSGMYCRRSDMALAVYAIPQTSVDFGGIARPSCRSTTLSNSGCSALSTQYPPFRISGEKGSPQKNERLEKVGQRSSWTSGLVDRTCADIRWPESDSYEPGPRNIALRCQHQVRAYSFVGDSGAPVFYWSGGNTVVLTGIVAVGNPEYYWYSSVDMIRLDLGIPLDSQTGLKTVF